jgi:DNA-binding transcriptional ArsR family regulator
MVRPEAEVGTTLTHEAATTLAEVMQGLASPARLMIVERLRESPTGVTSLANELGLSQATVSNHLRILRHAKLVTGDRKGKAVIYSLFDEHVEEFIDQAIRHLGHTA